MEYFYDDYSGVTMLKAGLEDFGFWYGDKAYREFGVVSDIQQEVVSALLDELLARLDKAQESEYGSAHFEWQQGIRAAMWEIKELRDEIDEKDLTPDDDSL